MSPAVAQAHVAAIRDTIRKVDAQTVTLIERIGRAETAGDYEEADRLRRVGEGLRASSEAYEDELERLTGQRELGL